MEMVKKGYWIAVIFMLICADFDDETDGDISVDNTNYNNDENY